MPIEIRELVIRATVDPSGAAGHESRRHKPLHGYKKSPYGQHAEAGDDVVQKCVREVLRILADKRER
jgi:hypothetical protein